MLEFDVVCGDEEVKNVDEMLNQIFARIEMDLNDKYMREHLRFHFYEIKNKT